MVANFCVYFHINPLKNEVFYVGMGKMSRPYSDGDRSEWWHRTVQKYGKIVDLVHENLTWKDACQWEMYYIRRFGRRDLGLGTLVNMTDGGDGVLGLHHSTKTKIKLSEFFNGRPRGPFTDDQLAKVQKAAKKRKGIPLTAEHRARVSSTLKETLAKRRAQK